MTFTATIPLQAFQLLDEFGIWGIWDDRWQGSAHENVARDALLGRAIASGAQRSSFRLWENVQALVVTRKETALPRFPAAAEALISEGWPVVVRETGGSAVPHGSGILQLSLVIPRSAAMGISIDAIFAMLCHPLQKALATVGVSSDYGRVPAAFCDGRYNLVVAGKKIAGTAQVWRANVSVRGDVSEGYVLAHASLFVDMDKSRATQVVNRFYALAGGNVKFDENALTTVYDCLCPSEKAGTAELTDIVRSQVIHCLTKNVGIMKSASGKISLI